MYLIIIVSYVVVMVKGHLHVRLPMEFVFTSNSIIFISFCLIQVAGAAAASGLSLADVAAEAKHASEMVGTMGVALSVCTLPGQVTSDRLGPGKMELGLGVVSKVAYLLMF